MAKRNSAFWFPDYFCPIWIALDLSAGKKLYGSATSGASQTQKTPSLSETQKGSASRHAPRATQAAGEERTDTSAGV